MLQNGPPEFSPVFVAVGTATSARRMPPRACPCSSRATTPRAPPRPLPADTMVIGGACGGGVPFSIQTFICDKLRRSGGDAPVVLLPERRFIVGDGRVQRSQA